MNRPFPRADRAGWPVSSRYRRARSLKQPPTAYVIADVPLAPRLFKELSALGKPVERDALTDALVAAGVTLLCVTAGSPYYCPHVQRPAYFPPSDGYQPPRDPLADVARLQQVTRDDLTRLPNRALLKDRLALAIAQAERNKRKLAVMFLEGKSQAVLEVFKSRMQAAADALRRLETEVPLETLRIVVDLAVEIPLPHEAARRALIELYGAQLAFTGPAVARAARSAPGASFCAPGKSSGLMKSISNSTRFMEGVSKQR